MYRQIITMSIKVTVSPSLSRDFRHFFGLKDLSWAPYEHWTGKNTTSTFCSFSAISWRKYVFSVSSIIGSPCAYTSKTCCLYMLTLSFLCNSTFMLFLTFKVWHESVIYKKPLLKIQVLTEPPVLKSRRISPQYQTQSWIFSSNHSVVIGQ